MIFLTIGTHEPFERLVRAVDNWCAQTGHANEVFGQITARGAASYEPQNFKWIDRLTPKEYAAQFSNADLIVSHAGMGSIITALHSGKPIVVMPRRGHLRETRNDHQYDTIKKLESRNGIYVAEDENSLGSIMDQALEAMSNTQSVAVSQYADHQFTDALREFFMGRNTK